MDLEMAFQNMRPRGSLHIKKWGPRALRQKHPKRPRLAQSPRHTVFRFLSRRDDCQDLTRMLQGLSHPAGKERH